MRSRIPRSPGRSSRTRASSTTGSCSRRGPTSSSWTSTAGIGVRARAGSRTGSTSTTSTGRPGSRTSSHAFGGRHAYYRWRSDLYGPLRPATRCSAGPSASPRRATSSGRIRRPREVYEPAGIDLIADLAESCAGPPSTRRAQEAPGPPRAGHHYRRPCAVTVGHRHAYLRNQARHLVGSGSRATRCSSGHGPQPAAPRAKTESRSARDRRGERRSSSPMRSTRHGTRIVSAQRYGPLAESRNEPRDHRWTALPLGAESRR